MYGYWVVGYWDIAIFSENFVYIFGGLVYYIENRLFL